MSLANKERTLSRECEAVLIPSGDRITLPEGTRVHITQTLGGSYTVMADFGLARISGENADALGEERQELSVQNVAPGVEPTEDMVMEQLRQCYDPEIPVNIVDLGLVYGCEIQSTERGNYRVEVSMTLTAPGCGMGPAIAADARSKIMVLPNIEDAEVNLVWDPPWNQEMISEEGKMKLGLI
jgi:probable FeS assembly SUF system protein SufT